MKPHANKPFPLAIFENSRIKPRHVFTFWALCNDIDSDSEGWISIDRKGFSQFIKKHVPVSTSNPIIMLELMHDLGFIELERFKTDPQNRNTTTKMLIRVNPGAWALVHTRKTESQTEAMRAFYKERYKLQRQALLKERELALSTKACL
jgi:hypothetical protein